MKISIPSIVTSVSIIFLLSCGTKTATPKTEVPKDSVVKETVFNKDTMSYETYQGLLPCKDCKGIQTTLQIAGDYQTYILTEVYTGIDTVQHIQKGSLNTERGYEKDEDATVYVLNSDKEITDQRVFVRETGNTKDIFEIGNDRKRLGRNPRLTLVPKNE
jgi:hypothetical protein